MTICPDSPVLGSVVNATPDCSEVQSGVWARAGTIYDHTTDRILLSTGNSVGTYTMQYDAMNRVTVVQDLWAQRLTFTYDAVGNRTKVQDSLSGTTTSVYDAANNLVTRLYGGPSQTPLRVDLTYNADNQVETVKRYSDLTATTLVAYSTYTYDVVNRISNLQHRKGSDNSNLANYTYTYDAGSRVTTEVRNGTTVTYTYDTADQLTADGTNTFTYDATGNPRYGFGPPVHVRPDDVVSGRRVLGRVPDPFIRNQMLRDYDSGWPD